MGSSVRRVDAYLGVQGAVLLQATRDGSDVEGPRLAVVGLVHGNEIVGGPVIDRLIDEASRHLARGSVLCVRGNLAAAELGARHTPDGTDLNRLWDRRTLERLRRVPPERRCYEEERALRLAPLLQTANAILDLHSTTRPSPPFLVFRDDQRHAAVASRLGIDRMVTGLHEGAILEGGMCPDVGLGRGERSKRLGFTYEAGQHDDPANVDRAWLLVTRLLAALDLWGKPVPFAGDWEPEVYEVFDRFQQVPGGTRPYRFVGHQGGEPGGGRVGSLRQLASFEHVQAGEVLLRRGHSVVHRAQFPFTMLLPTPAAGPGADLYQVARRRHTGVLFDGTVRSDDEAYREAVAVERMMGLLANDGYARGETWACFDSRLVLDRCADLVAGVLRLPVGHPHRCFTVVGRGDWGSGDGERRAARRYRQAMRRAIVQGVPLKRVQLLRGATLGWLHALTNPSMRSLLVKRAGLDRDDVGGRTKLYLSVRQPHTVSVLVIGDLERALADGDLRHVRVAVVVEAASVEPDDAAAHVRVVRAAFFSTRLEFLSAVRRLIHRLTDEHRQLMRGPLLGGDAEFQELLLDDLGIPARPDERGMRALRRALIKLQVELWQEQLGGDEPPPGSVSGVEAGRWLANTIATTGILDEETLRAMVLVPEDDDRYRIDLSGLWGLIDEPTRYRPPVVPVPGISEASPMAFSTPGDIGARPQVVSATLPNEPLLASDVDADNLSRWLGWKQFLRSANVIPDTRGKDLDLVFSEREIRRRFARWYRRARDLATQFPDRVMVVVASDGHMPAPHDGPAEKELHDAHLALLLDPRVNYLRIQHAQGTPLSWMVDFVRTSRWRPDSGAPVTFAWESEHGASVSVVMLATRESDDPYLASRRRLDSWRMRSCAVVASATRGDGESDHKVGLFTEEASDSVGVNQELLQFGRAHCDGLLAQANHVVRGAGGEALEDVLRASAIEQIARWIRLARFTASRFAPGGDVVDPEARDRWVLGQLNLVDPVAMEAVMSEVGADRPPEVAAAAIWKTLQGAR